MKNRIVSWFSKKYPRNYLIENPVAGAVILALFSFVFTVLYKPLHTQASQYLSFEMTMAVYSLGTGLSVMLIIWISGFFRWFSDVKEWTLIREIVSVILILVGIGTVIYLMGFFVESPGSRLNIGTFLNSVSRAFLMGLIPFVFFSALNYRYLYSDPERFSTKYNVQPSSGNYADDQVIRINSRLKKEELSFRLNDFIYAESDGNYVVFYILRNNIPKKEIIRNSISNIDQQLSAIPYFLRVHRAFIVNLKKVKSKQGNMLGYQLKLSDTDVIVPVSRNNILKFDNAFPLIH